MTEQVDFSKPPSLYWSLQAKLEHLQRRIIVYSIMYYKMGCSCVSDAFYDGVSRQLVAMAQLSPDVYKRTRYYYAMDDFDGSTGFDIPNRLHNKDKQMLETLAIQILQNTKR